MNTIPVAIVLEIIGLLMVAGGVFAKLRSEINRSNENLTRTTADNRTAIAVLAARVEGHSELFKKIEHTLERIERKLDDKADKL